MTETDGAGCRRGPLRLPLRVLPDSSFHLPGTAASDSVVEVCLLARVLRREHSATDALGQADRMQECSVPLV